MVDTSFFTDGPGNTGAAIAPPAPASFYVDPAAAASSAAQAADSAAAAAALAASAASSAALAAASASGKADLNGPAFTGAPTAPTPSNGDNSARLATTAWVFANAAGSAPATATPLMDGTAAVGTAVKYAREDHRHPTDTSRAAVTYVDAQIATVAPVSYVDAQVALKAPLASPALTGSPTAPTPAAADNSTKIATTAWVLANSPGGAAANPTAAVGLTAINGVASTYMRSDAAPALNMAITPTWTAAHKFGAAAALSSNYNVLSSRVNTGSSNLHGFAENSTYNLGASGLGVCAYDALSTFTGTQTYDHAVSFQSRPTYGSSGTITNLYGSWDQPTVNTGTVTNRYGHDVEDAIGTGVVTNNYGYYCAALTKGATLNYAFYSAGTTPSKFGGNVDVGGLSVAGVDATGAWAAYTPSIASGSGTLGTGNSSSGRYKQIGKTVFFTAQVILGASGAGTGATYLIVGLPVAAKQTSGPAYVFTGIRSGLVGLAAIIDTTTTIDVVDAAAGANPIANSRAFYISGSYEAA